MALATFPLPYVFEINTTKTFATKSVQFYSQKKQVQIQSPNPLKTWSITCKGTEDDLQTLQNFFDLNYGDAYPFYFTDEFGNQQTVRFMENKLQTKVYRDFDKGQVTHGFVVGFEATIQLEEAL